MQTVRRVVICSAVFCILAMLGSCCLLPTPAKAKVEAINNADVYRLAREALQPIADLYIESGDRILLANMPVFNGTEAWRFVPLPPEVAQEDYEGIILAKAKTAFSLPEGQALGETPEVKLLSDLFQLDVSAKKYKLKAESEKYNELLLGRTLAGTGYSGLEAFSPDKYFKDNPYFIDSFEGGLLAAVLKKGGRGFERLRLPANWTKYKNIEDHSAGRLLFNTNMLGFDTWKEIQDMYQPPSVAKLLQYSINRVISSSMDYIGIQASFRLIDVARGGKVLWSATKSLVSERFPKDKTPFLGTMRLTLPGRVVKERKDAMEKILRDQGIRSMNAVLVKIDDIPVFGSYPITHEDFAVENALEAFFSSLQMGNGQQATVMEKLYSRRYKEPWQLAHAVHYVNPLLGGDYSQFRNYYGAQYMIGYRVLWKNFQGVQLLKGDQDLEIGSRILGIYVKIIDMAGRGRIVLSELLPFGTEKELSANALYRCYACTQSLQALPVALKDAAIIAETTNTALINRRLEIANKYISEAKSKAEAFILNRLPQGGSQAALMMTCYDAYETLRTLGEEKEKSKSVTLTTGQTKEESWSQTREMNAILAVNLMQSWFEDGLCSALAAGEIAPVEKMEPLYSRYLLEKAVPGLVETGGRTAGENVFLSPLLLSQWGSKAPLKAYYGIDKILYFSLLETGTPATAYAKPPSDSQISRFFPLISTSPDTLQVSVVNVDSGNYEFRQDFPLK